MHEQQRFHWKANALLIFCTFVLCSCGFGGSSLPTVNALDMAAMQTSAIQTFYVELTRSIPTPTKTFVPTSTSTVTETPVPVFTPTMTPTLVRYRVLDSIEAAEMLPTHIAYYLVTLVSSEDCTFYMRPVLQYPFPEKTGDLVTDVTSALTMLFSLNETNIAGFLNPLAPTGHTVLSIDPQGSSMVIYISGNPMRTEDPCVNNQMRTQLFTTAGKISAEHGIYDIVIWVEPEDFLYDDYMIGR